MAPPSVPLSTSPLLPAGRNGIFSARLGARLSHSLGKDGPYLGRLSQCYSSSDDPPLRALPSSTACGT